MKFCLTTLYNNNFQSFMPYVIKSFEKFCEYNNCNLKIYDALIDDNIHPSWNKLLVLKELIKRYDIVLWADADSLFTGKSENFLIYNNFDSASNFMVSSDTNGVCLGYILINNSNYNLQLIDTMLLLKDVKNDNFFGDGPKWEQNTFKALNLHFNIKYQIFKYDVSVDVDCVKDKDSTFFYHYCCKTNEERLKYIKRDFENLYKLG
jgi:hypothetical protein